MARILGVELPGEKRTEIALRYIYGIGPSISRKILEAVKISPDKRAKDLSNDEVKSLANFIEQTFKVEGELKQVIFRNIKRLKDVRSYRGIRHKLGLPVRGQRTKSNAVTRKGRNLAVGGLKRKLEKT
ncbi:30S ribosomal protein S13 [Candidatus Dojkabacteria bacterium]|nr:30S ribosomal protein S13 [Candidatus Dojkabacteria bacterium]